MEKWKIVGWRFVNFQDKDNRNVTGYTLYLAREPLSQEVHGLEVMKQFISSQYVNFVPVENQMINISYNRFGKIASIEVI